MDYCSLPLRNQLIQANNICINVLFLALLLYGTKEKGKRFKNESRYTKTIAQLSNRMISVRQGENVIHYISHFIGADESQNKQLRHGAKKM